MGEVPLSIEDEPRRNGQASRYSRFVLTMKFLLPAIAILLVVAVILWPRFYEEDRGFTLSFTDIAGDDGMLQMINPRFVGSDAHDRPFTVAAGRASQSRDNLDMARLDVIQADLTLADGTWISFSAGRGTLYRKTERLELEGDIDVFSDRGYEFHARSAEIHLGDGRAQSREPVEGQGPFGMLSADSFELVDGGDRMWFRGNVRVRIYPGATG